MKWWLLFVALVWLALPATAAAQSAPCITPPAVNVIAPGPDPQAIADSSVQSSQDVIRQVIAPIPIEWAANLLTLPNVWTTTPANLTVENDQVRWVVGGVTAAAFGLIAAFILAAGLGHALGEEAQLGRLLFGVILAIGSSVWWSIGIGAVNAIDGSIGAPSLPALIGHAIQQPGHDAAIAGVILAAVYAVVAVMLLLGLLFRLGMLIVLIAAGPLALICYGFARSAWIGQLYIKTSVGFLFAQIPVVIAFRLAGVLGGLAGGVTGGLLGIVVLLVALKLPGLMLSGRPGGGPELVSAGAVARAVRRVT